MKKFPFGAGVVVGMGIGYLALWPVPIDPVKWDAPQDAGYVGAFESNTRLANLEQLPIGDTYGPEDVAYRETDAGLRIYVSGHKGEIIEINPETQDHRVMANTGGVPLGIEFADDGTLYLSLIHI